MILGGLYVAFVIIMSLIPGAYSPEVDPTKHDVLSHFTAYFIMMLWYARIYPAKNHPFLAVIFILLSFLLECAQGLTGTREFQTVDLLFNAMGVLSAWLLVRVRFTPAISK